MKDALEMFVYTVRKEMRHVDSWWLRQSNTFLLFIHSGAGFSSFAIRVGPAKNASAELDFERQCLSMKRREWHMAKTSVIALYV